MRSSHFQRGSGVFACRNCTRRTRATGGDDNEHVGLCRECYEIAGLENEMADGRGTLETIGEIDRLKGLVRAKGGVLNERQP